MLRQENYQGQPWGLVACACHSSTWEKGKIGKSEVESHPLIHHWRQSRDRETGERERERSRENMTLAGSAGALDIGQYSYLISKVLSAPWTDKETVKATELPPSPGRATSSKGNSPALLVGAKPVGNSG